MGAALAIGRARMVGPGAGEGRALLAPALEAVPLEALGLPPGALLLVPRLACPRPLRAGPARADFAEGLGRALADACAQAERDPVTGLSDRPRLFTSAAAHRAWRIGAMQDGLVAPAHHPPALRPATGADLRALLADGHLLPAVLARLTASGRAARLLSCLTPSEVEIATAALARSWPLPPQWPSLPRLREAPALLPTSPPHPLDRLLEQASASDPAIAHLAPPCRMLLLAALDVAQHPARIRDRHWLARLAHLATPVPDPSPPSAPGTSRERAGSGAPTPAGRPLPAPAPAPRRIRRSSTADPGQTRPQSPAPSGPIAPRPAGPCPDAQSPAAALAGVRSPHAGLLFLLNALVALGLTPGPAHPRAPGAAPLACLAALGHALFGAGFAADPLAGLAAGAIGPLPAVRPELLDPALAARALRRTAAPCPLLLLGPNRLVLADLGAVRRPNPVVAARRQARALGARLHPHPSPAPPLPRRGAVRRMAALARLLRHRLAAAGVAPRDLRVPGTLHGSDDALDVRFALADLPFAIRAAGLDRDPGFLPRAGLTVRFHFA